MKGLQDTALLQCPLLALSSGPQAPRLAVCPLCPLSGPCLCPAPHRCPLGPALTSAAWQAERAARVWGGSFAEGRRTVWTLGH